MPNPVTGSGLVRLESVQNAVEQAKAAAATIAGTSAPYVAVPWFWSNQGSLKIQMAGLTTEFDRVEIRDHVRGQEMSAFYFRAGRLCAAHAVNRPKDFMQGRKALTQNLTARPDPESNEAVSLTSVPAGTQHSR
ncbi:oxidoreductase C-terminal domain-containing protein [Mycolicibacterium stellerae]|uniref:oxidoreductase C-terminal domain-containing protein n=1 Tax=Mycolicibacterium stellerae TaxID=2358193 RepID=UPI0013DE52A8|nr:oxidoreductase C-terminal domain-containing protein [Mycolicibacterium stellerae]